MSMTLRIVIPPHPLIGHWLSILRIDSTPPAIYATGLAQLGKWLSYEAFRDWLPTKKSEINSPEGVSEITLIESNIPILSIPNLPGGLELWQGAKEIIPNASLCIGGVPRKIAKNAGIVIFLDQISDGKNLIDILNELEQQKISSRRLRIITVIAASEGLKNVGELFPEMTIYAACIDDQLTKSNEIIPGIGNPEVRLNTIIT